MRSVRIPLVVVLLAASTTQADAQQHTVHLTSASAASPAGADLAAIRAATEKYRDVDVAIADGYVAHPVCITAPMEGAPVQLGAMGYHYFRPDLLGIAATQPRVDGTGMHQDFTTPGILVYEPQQDGSVELVAIENLVWAKAWKEAGNTAPPAFQGQEYYYMHDNPETPVDEAHGFEPHYELHFWLYRENPAGVFAPFNAAASCAHAKAAPAGH